jgi:hypothetical protein
VGTATRRSSPVGSAIRSVSISAPDCSHRVPSKDKPDFDYEVLRALFDADARETLERLRRQLPDLVEPILAALERDAAARRGERVDH